MSTIQSPACVSARTASASWHAAPGRFAAGGHAELPQQALDVRADRVLGDVEALGDLVRAEMVVEQQKHLELACGQCRDDRVRDARVAAVAVSNLVEQPARDRPGEG